MFAGLSAFPLTPLVQDEFDEAAYARLVSRLVAAGVDSIGALGSTGSYAYLDRGERRRVARAAVQQAGDVPVIIGIGALRTSQVLALAHDAQDAGAAGVLLSAVSYQPLTDNDVFALFSDVTAELSVPLVIYDNPGTTHFTFTDDLFARVAALPRVASIKISPVSADAAAARARVAALRDRIPATVTIGVSGDGAGAAGFAAGCDSWYSVIGGLLPELAVAITRAAQSGDAAAAAAESARLQPLWDLFAAYGSLRVTAALAEHLGLVTNPTLPRPILGLDAAARTRLAAIADELQLGD